jgi:hypothetical protein
MVPAVHGEHDFVQVPRVSTSRLSAPKAIGIGLPELERPLSDGFIADDHPARGQDFFDIPEASRETKVAPHRMADDLGRIPVACIGIPLLVHRQNLADFSFFGKLTVPSWLVDAEGVADRLPWLRPVNTEVPSSRRTRPHRHAHVARRTGRPRPPTATTFLWIRPTGTGYDYGKEHGSIRSRQRASSVAIAHGCRER